MKNIFTIILCFQFFWCEAQSLKNLAPKGDFEACPNNCGPWIGDANRCPPWEDINGKGGRRNALLITDFLCGNVNYQVPNNHFCGPTCLSNDGDPTSGNFAILETDFTPAIFRGGLATKLKEPLSNTCKQYKTSFIVRMAAEDKPLKIRVRYSDDANSNNWTQATSKNHASDNFEYNVNSTEWTYASYNFDPTYPYTYILLRAHFIGSRVLVIDNIEVKEVLPPEPCCLANYYLDSALLMWENFEIGAKMVAEDEVTVQANGNVTFQAGYEIVLKPGFETEQGATFTAKIESCTSSGKTSASSTDTQEVSPLPENLKEETEDIPDKINDFFIHPNPTPGHFTLQLPDYESSGLAAHVSITDLTGRSVHQQETTARQLDMDLTEQAAGMYIVQVRIGYRLFTEKVVKE